ncbi:hypothetical protein PT974_00057 [Cladobotryum mycophilum]|uniref:RelA/SpoT domain-containing protein n=1 Tax=Cladobotryum mycophilum TaxID=491253 RepID=A0ABR0T122_9HYPO
MANQLVEQFDRVHWILKDSKILAIVSSRAKQPDSLRTKLLSRAAEKNYQSLEEIESDIADLAGVRVALYFPAQRSKVVELLGRHFDVKETREHPDSQNPGAEDRAGVYTATHLRVEFAEVDFVVENRYKSSKIEIQVVSLLMHVWSAVNHNLTYKELSGTPTEGEFEKLKEIHDHMKAGEAALDGLKEAFDERLSQGNRQFDSLYALGIFIRESFPGESGENTTDSIGPIEPLFQALRSSSLDTRELLGPHIERWKTSLGERKIEGQIANSLLEYLVQTNAVQKPELNA